MSQAVWRSPLLPLQTITSEAKSSSPPSAAPFGSGNRFKSDLLAYFRGYSKLGGLIRRLELYDFSAVRGALVASLPRKQKISNMATERSVWGLPSLQRILQQVPASTASLTSAVPAGKHEEAAHRKTVPPQIVIQVSSVATIGDRWPREFLFPGLSILSSPNQEKFLKPQFSIIFPTADEIRRSINGYSSGGSIHMHTQSSSQMKQLDYLRPMLCHWAGDHSNPSDPLGSVHEAGRRRTAPHIKTYIRFTNPSMTKIDWALMTSANLSNQAWGSETKAGEVRVCSYEIGIVVWPALWDEEAEPGAKTEMVPVFKKNTPEASGEEASSPKIGLRMPYDLPLVPYGKDEMPWCASTPCSEPDWMGRSWPGFGAG